MRPSSFASCQRTFIRILSLMEKSLSRAGKRRSWRLPDGYRLQCAVLLLCVAAAIASPAQTFTSLASFAGKESPEGLHPNFPLVQGLDGNLYGTASEGGLCDWACGTVFRITRSGALTTLYSFCVGTDKCPSVPYAGLTLGTDGRFYGTTLYPSVPCGNACGTIFQITPGGSLTVLHSFDGSDGETPEGSPLLQAMNGNFYGMTSEGGAHGLGTIFETTSSGTLTTLYNFCSQTNCTDGREPTGGLVQAPNGIFYGTTLAGGTKSHPCNNFACGTVFSITSAGKLTTLYDFCPHTGCADGAIPSGLVQGSDGNFYGTTGFGGISNTACAEAYVPPSCGTVFKITPGGTLTTLYRFCAQAGCPDGANPGALVEATDGNFYGVTGVGGTGSWCVGGCGTIFKITPQGVLTTLHSLCAKPNCTDGSGPETLVQATDGNLYGVTEFGGKCSGTSFGCGTVFKLSVGLGPFVKTLPTSGKEEATITILGTNLTDATSVTFHYIAATFTVVSRTEIRAIVPAGAITGRVRVTTPSGTLTSNIVFEVRP